MVKWFKHDSNASIDAKLQDILLDYGATGYGLYWYCVELIAKDVTPKNITFELEHDARIIARNLNLSVKETQDMMQKMVDVGLFNISKNNKIACVKLAYRLDDSMRKGAQISEIIETFKNERQDLVGKIPDDSGKYRKNEENPGKVRLDIDIDIDKEIDIDIDKKKAPKSARTLLSQFGIDGNLADDFIAHRKSKKAPITETALRGIEREAKKAGITMQKAVTISIEKNWQGFNAGWDWKPQAGNRKRLSDESIRSLDFLDDVT